MTDISTSTIAFKRYKSNIIRKTTYFNVTIKPKRRLKIVKQQGFMLP